MKSALLFCWRACLCLCLRRLYAYLVHQQSPSLTLLRMVCLLIAMPHGIATSAVLCMQEIAACSQHHTEVALVSDWSPNLSFWSQMTPVATLHQPAALPLPPYAPNCTYVAIITSDGDSLQVSNDAQVCDKILCARRTAGILQLHTPLLHSQCCGLQGAVLCSRNSRLALALVYMAHIWFC